MKNKKQYFESFITYCFLGRRNKKTEILGYSRRKQEMIDDLHRKGWKDSELIIEALEDGLKETV